MKKILTLLFFATLANTVFCQEAIKNDTIFLLNNEEIVCNVTNITELEIMYSYVGESLTNTISKKRVKEIHFGSGRIQKFSELIIINGEKDWEKVQLTTLQTDVDGLVRKGEVKSRAVGSGITQVTNATKERAERKLKIEAAKLGAHIIFLQVYKIPDGENRVDLNGVAYGYNNDSEGKNEKKPDRGTKGKGMWEPRKTKFNP